MDVSCKHERIETQTKSHKGEMLAAFFCHKDTKTQRHKDTKTQRHKDTKTQRHKDTKTQRFL